MTALEEFVVGEIPGERLLVEASAGTGKTHSLAGLAVHLLGRGEVTPDRLLVVTYTRLATAELRERIWSMLAEALSQLDKDDPDPAVAALVGALAAWDRETARRNLQNALSGYDAVTVTTIHGFAQRALASFGSIAGIDPDFEVLGEGARLIRDVAADQFAVAAHHLAGVLADDRGPDPSLEDLALYRNRLPVNVAAIRKPAASLDELGDLEVLPTPPDPGPLGVAGVLADPAVSREQITVLLARRAARVAAARRRNAGLRSYEDLLTGLHDALMSPAGPALAKRQRDQFRLVLIDEFQDTNHLQWDIFDRCFGRGGSRLVLVGDPKQAIYTFRGADVHTYARVAAESGFARRVLTTNWRSDGDVLTGLEALWRGVVFGDGTDYVPVRAAPGNEGSRLRRSDGGAIAPVEVALADTDALKSKPKSKFVAKETAERAIHRYVVDHVVDLLTNVQIADPADAASSRPVVPGDIALLVKANSEGRALAEELRRAHVPAVVHGSDDVRVTAASSWNAEPSPSEAAGEWRLLLEALAEPSDLRVVRAASVGVFGPFSAPGDLVGVDEAQIERFQQLVAEWAATLARSGAAAMVGRVWAESQVVPEVLGRAGGDRLMTDLEHIGELFDAEVGIGPVAPDRLIAVLTPEPDAGAPDGRRVSERRIPTDAPAVTIMTVHKAKGLEFPIVGCVGLHKLASGQADRSYDAATGRQVIDLARSDAFKQGARREQREEQLRLLYVGLTRARHQVFTCWAHEMNSKRGALNRLLFARDSSGDIDPARFGEDAVAVPAFRDAVAILAEIGTRSGGTVGTRILGREAADAARSMWTPAVAPTTGPGSAGDSEPRAELGVATLDRWLDRRSGRWSFTTVTARESAGWGESDDAPSGSGGDEGQPHRDDAGDDLGVRVSTESATRVSPLAWLPAGTAFGTLAHAVLEQVDFTDVRLDDALGTALDTQQSTRAVPLTPTGPGESPPSGRRLFIDGLGEALSSPLGTVWDGRRLCDLPMADRLSECDFDLRLDAPADRPVTGAVIGSLIAEHLSADDPYRAWAEGLARGRIVVDLAGHLTGSIDLVARLGSGTESRFVVSDYKTNRLHRAGQPPEPGDYRSGSLIAAMIQHDYPLQALLYSVALHRYLRWRLGDYDPAVHLGGVTYLFLRGLTCAADVAPGEEPPGVAAWRIPPAAIEALDARFAGRKGES